MYTKNMNDDTINDLKQFIAATVTQQISDVRSDIKDLDDKLSVKIDDLAVSVADALESTNEDTDVRLKDHAQRIAHLEQKAA